MSSIDRATMEREIKAQCVPALRRAGFKGSFPDFYRETDGFVALVNFQFFSSGGSLCVNLSYADTQRKNISFRPETQARDLKVSSAQERRRLGGTHGDKWFSFGATNYGEFRGAPTPPHEIIATIKNLLETEAEPWWKLKQEA